MKNLILKVASLFFSALISTASAQLPSYLPTNGLVAWYPFNGNANDESGNGNDGVVNGATLAVDRFGLTHKAYQFDGIDDFIEVPVQQQNISSYAIMCWFQFPTSPISGDYKALVQASGGYPNSQYSLSLQISANPLFPNQADNKVSVSINGPGVFNGRISNSTYNDDIWHCLVGVWDAPDGAQTSSSFVKMYLDGALLNESATAVDYGSVLTPVSGYGNTLIGMMNHLIGGRYYHGGIDDIAIYNRALSAAEVTALFTATATNNGGGTTSTSPAPPGIPYQAEVRNDNGEVLANANVNVRFTLHELTANGTVSYQESHALTTNELGLFAATIGAGTATQGTFAGINWAQTTKFLQVEVDAGNGYITMGNQQLMSVPYALYAANGPVGPQGPAGADGQQGPPGSNGQGCFTHYIGEHYGGGIVFHVYRDSLGIERGLIVYPEAINLDASAFGDYSVEFSNCTNEWDGLENTQCIASAQNSGIGRTIADFAGNSYNDWYIPSITEFKLLENSIYEIRKSGFMHDVRYSLFCQLPFWTSTAFSEENSPNSMWIDSFSNIEFPMSVVDMSAGGIPGVYSFVLIAVRKF